MEKQELYIKELQVLIDTQASTGKFKELYKKHFGKDPEPEVVDDFEEKVEEKRLEETRWDDEESYDSYEESYEDSYIDED